MVHFLNSKMFVSFLMLLPVSELFIMLEPSINLDVCFDMMFSFNVQYKKQHEF